MIKNILKLLLTILIFSSCGFSPVYKGLNYDFSVEVENYSGDRILNSYIKNNLSKYNKKNQNKIFVSYSSEYEKYSLVKDASGKTTEYEIIAKVIFIIKINQMEKKFNFQEKMTFTTLENNFDENDLQNNILYNFSTLFVEKLILEIVNAN